MTGPRLLVHCCCVHCSAFTLAYWQSQGYEVVAYWYNPNIYPFEEHQARLHSLVDYLEDVSVKLIFEKGYSPERYEAAIGDGSGSRCSNCYSLRLDRTFEYAKEAGFDAFTSSLLISPQQQHEAIISEALKINDATGPAFKYADIRKRYTDSRRLTNQYLGLHRQTYCGCSSSALEAGVKYC